MEATIYNQGGKKAGSVTLPAELFGVPWNADIVHQVAVSFQSNARRGTAHTKDRSEVRGGGKKPWRQKGTGRARHGSSRSPIWVGGGVTHGPRAEKNYEKRIPKRMNASALASLLSKKYKDGEVAFINTLSFSGKTREAKEALNAISGIKGLEALSGKKKNALLIVVTEKKTELQRATQNIGNIKLTDVRAVNLLDLLTYKFVAFVSPEEAVEIMKKRVAKPAREKKQ